MSNEDGEVGIDAAQTVNINGIEFSQQQVRDLRGMFAHPGYECYARIMQNAQARGTGILDKYDLSIDDFDEVLKVSAERTYINQMLSLPQIVEDAQTELTGG